MLKCCERQQMKSSKQFFSVFFFFFSLFLVERRSMSIIIYRFMVGSTEEFHSMYTTNGRRTRRGEKNRTKKMFFFCVQGRGRCFNYVFILLVYSILFLTHSCSLSLCSVLDRRWQSKASYFNPSHRLAHIKYTEWMGRYNVAIPGEDEMKE